MGPPQPIERLRLTPRSAVLTVGMFGVTVLGLGVISSAARVIGWILAAAAIAGLLHPLCARLSRRIPNGLAVVVVVLLSIGTVGLVAYAAVGGLVHETRVLQQAAPRRAAELERSHQFGSLARQFKLVEKTRRLVKEAPERLRGGTPAQALRAATTRGVAFLATTVLTLFLLLHGPTMARAAAHQVRAPLRRDRLERVALASYRRSFGYARGTVAMSLAVGLVAFVAARVAGVPGAAPLALWAGLWDAVPLLGALLGTLPIIGLAAADDLTRGIALAAVFVGYQVFEARVLQRRLERRTIRLGPFLTVAGGFAGLELYGIGGALLVLLAITVSMAVADELAV